MGCGMKDIVGYARMLDIYGGILTEKQYDILESYYCRDLTLEEIAENHSVSRQAVHYAVKNAEEKIQKLEAQLHIMEKYDTIEKRLTEIRDSATAGRDDMESIVQMLSKLINEL